MSNRLKFFLSHLVISVLVALWVSWLVFFVWYPAPLARALGVTHLFLMLIVIDVVIGPLLGFLVYKEGKKSLKFDLATVIILQIAAFSYGFYTIAEGRPSWIVYDSLTFHVIKKSDIETQYIAQAKPEFQQSSWFKPQFVALDVPAKRILIPVPQDSIALDHPMYYIGIADAKLRMQIGAFPLPLLENYNNKQIVSSIVKQYPNANAWVGLSAPVQDMVVLINKENAEVIKIVDLRPWN